MLAISTLSPDATAFLYLISFLVLAVAALIAYLTSDNGFKSGAMWLCVGLSLYVLVSAWNALAAT